MRPRFEPALVNDAFGDPSLYVDFRDERRALLLDFGDVSALPPRKLLRLSHVFVSHTHMDHFVGFDHWLRVVLGRKDHATLTGGPGFIGQIEHKLAAYTWNVVHRYEVPLTLEVHEVDPGGAGRCARFSSQRRFAREDGAGWTSDGDVLLAEESFRVRARFLDHDILCLAFAVEEATHINVWKNRLAEMGLATGPWLSAARQALAAGQPDATPIAIAWHDSAASPSDADAWRAEAGLRVCPRTAHRLCDRYALHRGELHATRGAAHWRRPPVHRKRVSRCRRRARRAQESPDRAPGRHDRTRVGGAGEHRLTRALGELRPAFELVAGQRIGYVTDTRYTEANCLQLDALLAGVDRLYIESVFLDADAAHAERKNHLTARQAGTIARRIGARAVVPFHFSPRYEDRSADLIAEVKAAWQGSA